MLAGYKFMVLAIFICYCCHTCIQPSRVLLVWRDSHELVEYAKDANDEEDKLLLV